MAPPPPSAPGGMALAIMTPNNIMVTAITMAQAVTSLYYMTFNIV
jgi:hypothetical protein